MFGESVNFIEAIASQSNLDHVSDMLSYHREELDLLNARDDGNNMTFEVNYRGVDASNHESTHTVTFVTSIPTEISVSRCSQMLGSSAMHSNYDSIQDRIDRPLDSYSFSHGFDPAQRFAPGVFATLMGTSAAPTTIKPNHAQAVQPPLIPAVTLNTIFTCSRSVDDIVQAVTSVLSAFGEKLVSQFCSTDFSWNCTYISEGFHVEFLIKVYRYSKRHELYGSYAVEFQRLEGDRIPYMNAYNSCRDILTSTECNAFDYFANPESSGISLGFSSAFDCSSSFGSLPESLPADDESNKTFIKDSIVKQLSVPASTYNNILENIQLISSLYCDEGKARPSFTSVDTELFLALCGVARKYSTNTRDWIFQHSVIAVADMLTLLDKCDCASNILTTLKGHESVTCVLQSMAGLREDNCFVATKCEQISKMISLLC